MKEININKKLKVIKMFFSGVSYDDIAEQVGIAKGSVVNIIDEFRDGSLPVPPGTTGYIDTLRQLAVDLLKHQTTVPKLKSYMKLHTKLEAMGINSELVEQWLDICQGIASTTVSNDQFVEAALELAQLTSNSGLSCEDVSADYTSKLSQLKTLDAEIEQKKGEMGQLELKHKEEKQLATDALNSINKAMATAQDAYQKQKDDLKSQLDEYLTHNELTWDNINTVSAILHSVLSNSGLDQKDIEKISTEIANAGSLVIYTGQLEHQKEQLESTVEQLSHQEKALTSCVGKLGKAEIKLFDSILNKRQEEKELDARLEVKRAKLAELEQIASSFIDLISVAHLILGFLLSPKGLSNNDIDELARLMIYVRQYRLGIDLQQVKYDNGNVICECRVPKLYFDPDKYNISVDEVRRRIALLLVPLVQDKFMPRWEHDAAQLAQITQSLLELQGEVHDLL